MRRKEGIWRERYGFALFESFLRKEKKRNEEMRGPFISLNPSRWGEKHMDTCDPFKKNSWNVYFNLKLIINYILLNCFVIFILGSFAQNHLSSHFSPKLPNKKITLFSFCSKLPNIFRANHLTFSSFLSSPNLKTSLLFFLS